MPQQNSSNNYRNYRKWQGKGQIYPPQSHPISNLMLLLKMLIFIMLFFWHSRAPCISCKEISTFISSLTLRQLWKSVSSLLYNSWKVVLKNGSCRSSEHTFHFSGVTHCNMNFFFPLWLLLNSPFICVLQIRMVPILTKSFPKKTNIIQSEGNTITGIHLLKLCFSSVFLQLVCFSAFSAWWFVQALTNIP